MNDRTVLFFGHWVVVIVIEQIENKTPENGEYILRKMKKDRKLFLYQERMLRVRFKKMFLSLLVKISYWTSTTNLKVWSAIVCFYLPLFRKGERWNWSNFSVFGV